MRPWLSVLGMRWTRWVPLSNFRSPWTPSPVISVMTSLNPPSPVSLALSSATRQPLASAELVLSAETQSRERLDEAENTSRNQMQEADVYALQTLHGLEEELDRFLTTVQRGIETLEQRSAERPGAQLESGG